MPDHVDGALEAIGAHRWTRPVCPPVRLTAVTPVATRGPLPPWMMEMRMPRPQEGQDRYWVIWTKGEVSAPVAERALAD
eukprot:5820893-Lingulodinium_polyedra.AAC.1